MSGIGKGITTAALGSVLQSKGFRVTAIKADPYINVDAGTMNPTEHGEVFVTEDGLETDQDIGNYERFLNTDIKALNYMTTGQIYLSVIQRERNLEYKGKCVEVVPHIPEEVISRIKRAGKQAQADFVLVEIGGTVGEYQNLIFLEAARMMHVAEPSKVAFVIVSFLPTPPTIGEMKTKPTQYAVRTLNSAGIQPDFIVARAAEPLDTPRKEKLSRICSIRVEHVISAPDAHSIYEVPLLFEREHLGDLMLKMFHCKPRRKNSTRWRALVKRMQAAQGGKPVKIGIVGKYFKTGRFTLSDSYISVIEAIKHASWEIGVNPEITWLNAQEYEDHPAHLQELLDYDGLIVPGGFGSRGVEGKILTAGYARRKAIPYFGLCYGMHMACIEFARNVLKLSDANTTEVAKRTPHAVIDIMPEQKGVMREKHYGATMRLGAYRCKIIPGTLTRRVYGVSEVKERHRHRYEFMNAYKEKFNEHGLLVAGTNPERGLVEIVELADHPFFIGTQFHPELTSRPFRPHPLFVGFMKAAKIRQEGRVRTKKAAK